MIARSLRSRILFGYLTVAALLVGTAGMAFLQLEAIDRAIETERVFVEFFDLVRELRSREKNLALYRKQVDFRESEQGVLRALALLEERRGVFLRLTDGTRLDALAVALDDHSGRLGAYWQILRARPAHARAAEDDLTGSRAALIAEAQDMAEIARKSLEEALKTHRLGLLLSVAVLSLILIGIGKLLSRRVAQPLKELEQRMEAVAQGEVGRIELGSSDREITSLSSAFNHVLFELEARRDAMVRSEKLASLGTMLSGVAHELNNPLSNVSSSTQILLEELEQGDLAYQRELLTQIDGETDRARQIVRALLDFAPQRAFRREAVALRPLLEDTLRLLGGQIPETVAVDLDVPEGLTVAADRPRLQQVALNLVRNALEAMPAGGRLAIRAAGGNGAGAGAPVDIEFEDSGTGIPPHILPHVFDPFFSTKEVGKGSGLGLFVAHQIVEEHGGAIRAENLPAGGARFALRLPAAGADAAGTQ
jgi:signal transduction histidine kinase